MARGHRVLQVFMKFCRYVLKVYQCKVNFKFPQLDANLTSANIKRAGLWFNLFFFYFSSVTILNFMSNNQLVFVTKYGKETIIICYHELFIFKKRLLNLFCIKYILKSMFGAHHHHKAKKFNFICCCWYRCFSKFCEL